MNKLAHAMDQFSAHLDRAWDMVQQEQFREAEAAARQALKIDDSSPEVHNILGYLAAIEGDTDAAIEHYSQAYDLDDTFLEAILNAAELYVHPIGDFDQAVKLCENALAVSDTIEEQVEALLLMFDAYLGKDDMEAARMVVERIPSGPYEHPNHAFLIGRAMFEIGAIDQAAPLVEEAANKDPLNAEAWYYLALIRDQEGRHDQATEAFLKARSLDLQLPQPPWSLSMEAFQSAADRAAKLLPTRIKQLVEGSTFIVSDVPGIELVADGIDPRALVLVDGEQERMKNGEKASRVFLYQRNIERVAGAPEHLEEVIAEAVTREVDVIIQALSSS